MVAPPPYTGPMYVMRRFWCGDCGVWTERRRHEYQPRICRECSMIRGVMAAREMAAKSGPAYDRWRDSDGPKGRPRRTP